MKKITVAIDGYSSSGKSTMARELARRVGFTYVDSGAMYRAVTLYAMEQSMTGPDGSVDAKALVDALPGIRIRFSHPDPEDMTVQHTMLNGRDVEREIRTIEVSSYVSPVATIPEVREYLVDQQQAMGREGGIVMDGRDIGTTVFPDAELKVFVNASAEERARRRVRELQAKGENVSYDEVLTNVRERDYIDTHREVSPLRRADDSILLDNDHMTPAEQMNWLLNEFHKAADGKN